jgi:hypothetical protein
MARWRKNGGPSVAVLPAYDSDAAGTVWTGLEINAEGREACGWSEAGVPDEVGMVEARAVLRQADQLADIDAWVLLQPELIQDAWFRRSTLRRNSPLLLAAAAARGLAEKQLDDLFIAADAFASANNL